MVSSINHHISILKLRVHPFYLKFLEAGVAPPSASSQPLENDGNTQPSSAQTRTTEEQHPWYVLKLQRTRWYDLFSVEDRVEAMKGVWGVLTWLMRGKEGDDVEMTDQSID